MNAILVADDDEAIPGVIVNGERNNYAGICGPSITLRTQLTRRLAVASGRLACAALVVRQTATREGQKP